MEERTRVALRVGRTREGWRRWYAYPVIEHGPGLYTINESAYTRLSPGHASRSDAAAWATEHNLVVVW